MKYYSARLIDGTECLKDIGKYWFNHLLPNFNFASITGSRIVFSARFTNKSKYDYIFIEIEDNDIDFGGIVL